MCKLQLWERIFRSGFDLVCIHYAVSKEALPSGARSFYRGSSFAHPWAPQFGTSMIEKSDPL